MKYVRNLALLAVVMLLTWSVGGGTAFGQAYTVLTTPHDTVANNATNIQLLQVELTGFDTDTLTSVKLRSYIEKEYAISSIKLFKNAAATPFKTYTISGRFDANYEATLAGFNVPFDANDTLTVKVDAWTDSVDTDTSYHMTGLEVVIPPKGLVFKHDGVNDTLFNGTGNDWIANPAINSSDGLWNTAPPDYIVLFDLYAPIYDVAVTILDTTTVPNDCTNIVNIGDSLFILVSNVNEEVSGNSVKVDLSAFGGDAAHELNYHANGAGFADDTWTDTVRVGSGSLDVIPGYVIYFTATDNAGNTGTESYQFVEPIDDIAPVFDSLKFFISQNNMGSDTSAALGDRLTVIAYMTSNGYFENTRVVAVDRWNNFRSDTTTWEMEDITNGNNIWRVDIWLTTPLPIDLPVGDTILKHIYLTAFDDACNSTTDSTNLDNAIDLDPPVFSNALYHTIDNADSSSCTNLGDSVRVSADLTGSPDVASVWGDFLHAGIGGTATEAFVNKAGDWENRWKIGSLTDPALDPESQYARDMNSLPVNTDYTVWIYAEDDAGNLDSMQTTALTAVLGGSTLLDTRRPTAIDPDSVVIKQLAGGKLQLLWPASYPSQAGDAQFFYVYVDSTGAGFNYDNIFGTTFNLAYDNAVGPDTNAWKSEVLTNGKTYRFVIRTKDDCGNPEFNTNMFSAEADAAAPIACVVFPSVADTGKYYGPGKPLNITATTTAHDLATAWVTYRRHDVPSGSWGPWVDGRTIGTIGLMTIEGQTLFEGIVLGDAPSTKGYYQLYILTTDSAGNVLPLDTAQAYCSAFTFFWNPDQLVADIYTINGSASPQNPGCGFTVWRDSVNTAVVTVMDPLTTPVYTIDAWVMFMYPDVPENQDSVRIDFKDFQTVPYSFGFSVTDWPKSNDGIPTKLYVRITNSQNGASGLDSVTLCVPDVKAPDITMTYPAAYSRVPIAKSSMNMVPVRAKILGTSYDPDSPVRMEFFYQLDGTSEWVKIGETGTPLASKGIGGKTALISPSFPEFQVMWDNSALSEGFVWLKAIVHDNVDNTQESPAIKVYLDKTVPLMTLSIPDALMLNGKLTVMDPGFDHFINLNAEITNNTIDIAKVEFFISYRDSVDLVKFYHKIGDGYAALNNSIWRYEWFISEWTHTWDGEEWEDNGWMKCGFDYKLRIKVTDIAGNVYDDTDGDGQFDDYTFWANPFAAPISLITPADASKLIFRLDCGAPQVAIYEATAGDRTYQTPSTLLGGPGIIYMKKGESVGVQSVILDSLADLTGIEQVEYFFDSPVQDDWVSVGVATASPYHVSFDPFALGLITKDDVFHNEFHGGIRAILTDSLHQTTQDQIELIVLDTFPGDAAWRTPTQPYVWGSVDMSIWALQGDDAYRQVVYKYKTAGGAWTDITTVRRIDDADIYFTGVWATLNTVPDGAYILGFETTDQNLNVKSADENPQINVNVQNAMPTITISSPTNGSFICGGEIFVAEVGNGPVGYVDFQWKTTTSTSWENFSGPGDNFAPWQKIFETPEEFVDGFYNFRAVVVNQAGREGFSPMITLFFDGTNPLARILSIQAPDTSDVEYNNDYSVSIDRTAGVVTVSTIAIDSLSSAGSQAIYNSGVASVGLYLTTGSGPSSDELIASGTPDASGHFTFSWDVSGLAPGTYVLLFKAYDNVGCNVGTDSVVVYIFMPTSPYALVAGFWNGKIVGVTYSDEPVQFQYKTTGDWIPIGIGHEETSESFFYYDNRWQSYAVYAADWLPADGSYQLRMLNSMGEDFAPVLSATISGGVMTATSNPASGWGPGTIEKNAEQGCNLEGVARFTSSFGFPFGVNISMDQDDQDFVYQLVDFKNYPQQGTSQLYAGPFEFFEMEDGGPAWGEVFFCDYNNGVGYSSSQSLATWWVTNDLGTGGTIKLSPNGVDTIWVSIPQEFEPSSSGFGDALVIWESSKPDPCVWQDYILTPVSNRNGQANYIGLPGLNCEGLCTSGSDERYAKVKMTYDEGCNLPEESLLVAWWDGDGHWVYSEDVFFPSTVAGFNTAEHTVEFATTCLHGTYALVKRTLYNGQEIVTRKDMIPSCGNYTSPFPSFHYQFSEPFPNSIEWSTLQVLVDGVPVYLGPDADWVASPGVKGVSTPKTLDEADFWEVNIDEVSGVVMVEYIEPGSPDGNSEVTDPSETNSPLACGEHTLFIKATNIQLKPQFLEDHFVVDCQKPVVTFPNSYIGKDPTIHFTINDDASGVKWDSVFVDVFFVSTDDSASAYYGYPRERVTFIQTFFPGQIENYLSGNSVSIPTSYDLSNKRAMLVVVYNGHRRVYLDGDQNWGIDPGAYDQFQEYYLADGGAPDCVGNNATPHVQWFTVDSRAPIITRNSTTATCPMVFTIGDDGAGVTAADITILEDGIALGEGAEQSSASAVNSGGKWYFAPSGGGGLLYYCPTAGVKAEIVITDEVGNVVSLLVFPESPLAEGDVVAMAGPNPFDPAQDAFNLKISLHSSANVTVKIYDMGGDLITTLRSGAAMNAGDNLVAWNGTADGGRMVARGAYLAHIVAENSGGSAQTVVKIAVVEK